ncbi:hypothetical protein T265_14518, partial [Opisthorchis viverrini]
MQAPSGEDGPAHYEAISRRRYLEMTSKCAELRKTMAKQRAATARKFLQEQRAGDAKGSLIGPGCMAFARSSVHVQTGLYLEELTEQIEQDDFATQTDYFLDRPPTPLFVPAKTGVDVATQIYENDLFDFELEVQPILEVLCGKTIEQALLEVAEEEELADLRCQQQVLQEIHNADLAEVARLEDRNRRYEKIDCMVFLELCPTLRPKEGYKGLGQFAEDTTRLPTFEYPVLNREEKQRRKVQYEKAMKLARETAEKIAAKAFTKAYLSPLMKSTFEQLLERGYFYDSVEHVSQHEVPSSFTFTLFFTIRLSNKLWLYGSETSVLNTDAMLSMMTYWNGKRYRFMCFLLQAIRQRHHEFRELGRAICEKACIRQVLPSLRTEVANYVIDRSARLALQRLELAAASTREIREAVNVEILNDAIYDVALEVQAQKEAEEAAENAETT